MGNTFWHDFTWLIDQSAGGLAYTWPLLVLGFILFVIGLPKRAHSAPSRVARLGFALLLVLSLAPFACLALAANVMPVGRHANDPAAIAVTMIGGFAFLAGLVITALLAVLVRRFRFLAVGLYLMQLSFLPWAVFVAMMETTGMAL
ncbi:MAG: hypothetical protein IH851_09875 [Armatimonadetes bacterium]|nr:hypothetical protein [Armatimonadota bacterium]